VRFIYVEERKFMEKKRAEVAAESKALAEKKKRASANMTPGRRNEFQPSPNKSSEWK
jgi:hypothetical protein